MKTAGASSPLTAQQRMLVAKLFRDDPGATRRQVADRAARLLGRRVTEDQVRLCRPADLVECRQGRPPLARTDAPPPARRGDRGLPYPTPLADLILEARAVRRRLGLGRARKEVAA